MLRRWAAEGLHDLAPEAMTPLLAEVERAIGVRRIPAEIAGGNARAPLRGAAALGVDAALLERNERGCIGSGSARWAAPRGRSRTCA